VSSEIGQLGALAGECDVSIFRLRLLICPEIEMYVPPIFGEYLPDSTASCKI
jgi:hypothetical protein